jgi:hypothetical protein
MTRSRKPSTSAPKETIQGYSKVKRSYDEPIEISFMIQGPAYKVIEQWTKEGRDRTVDDYAALVFKESFASTFAQLTPLELAKLLGLDMFLRGEKDFTEETA